MWPIGLKQKPQDLAQAGFFYSGQSDVTICFSCENHIAKWEVNDNPWVEHDKLTKDCNFIKENIEVLNENIKNAEYNTIDFSQGYLNIKERLQGLQEYDWYVGDMSRQCAESLLKQNEKKGCFVVRKSPTKSLYILSLLTKNGWLNLRLEIEHYPIKQNSRREFYLNKKHCCKTIPDLIEYHRHNPGGLKCRLKVSPPCDRPVPRTAELFDDKWEIPRSQLEFVDFLGCGHFGVVRLAKLCGSIDVAVKEIKEIDPEKFSEDDFIEEAKMMTKLQHPNLVKLYGVCSKNGPIYIVTEYMRHGSLLDFLNSNNFIGGMRDLLVMCIQVCRGMSYLESKGYIHRDLAARNCLVGLAGYKNIVKVADFGLTRFVLDDQYKGYKSTFPYRWASPEVLLDGRCQFSSKSDVWAYGVLMWEVFTLGQMPYADLGYAGVVERIQGGIILEKPSECPQKTYNVMKLCWSHSPEDRPSFHDLENYYKLIARSDRPKKSSS